VPGAKTEDPTIPTIFETCDYDGNCTQYPVNTPVTLKNPCIDDSLVFIVPPKQFNREDYLVGTGDEIFTANEDFIVSTLPITHSLCGSLNKKPQYQPVDSGDFRDLTSSDPVTYDEVN